MMLFKNTEQGYEESRTSSALDGLDDFGHSVHKNRLEPHKDAQLRRGASVAVNTPDVGLVGRSLLTTQTLDLMSFFLTYAQLSYRRSCFLLILILLT